MIQTELDRKILIIGFYKYPAVIQDWTLQLVMEHGKKVKKAIFYMKRKQICKGIPFKF